MVKIEQIGKTVHVTAGILLRPDGKIFIGRRNPDKKRGGYLEFVGGKREKGEDALTCLVREVLEETGMTLHREQILAQWRPLTHTYPDGQTVVLYPFVCRVDPAKDFSPREYNEWMWLSPEELPQWIDQFLEADKPIVKRLIAHDY